MDKINFKENKKAIAISALAALVAGVGVWRLTRRGKDPHRWLEDVLGKNCLSWVSTRNEHAVSHLGDPKKTDLYNRLLAIYDSKDKIPYVSKIGDYYYNFWKDEHNIRGVWRRTVLEEYVKEAPEWTTVLDLDALGKEEGENWVWKGHTLLDQGPGQPRDRTIISLSRGGADATVKREFDLTSLAFVPGGFSLPEAKSRVSWKTRDVLWVGTDFGPGSLTDSGYPRVSKEWRRGTSLGEATLLFEAEKTDIAGSAYTSHDHEHIYYWFVRTITFYTAEHWLLLDGKQVKLPVPDDMEVDSYDDQLLLKLRSDWVYNGNTYTSGSLVAVPLVLFANGEQHAEVCVLFAPTARSSLEGYTETRGLLVLSLLEEVKTTQRFWSYRDHHWTDLGAAQEGGMDAVSMWAVDSDNSDQLWVSVSGYTKPSSLYLLDPLVDGKLNTLLPSKPVKALPAQFDAKALQVQQFFATSLDGTRVPYFCVSRQGLALDGQNKALLYGYGGFEISLTPSYSGTIGTGHLEQGWVYVQANIRGGGEFGASWHQAALKSQRNKAYEDFEAVAEDLIRRGVTSSKRLAIQGGSNGGLLMGNMLVRRPELFGAIVCQVPLLDMKRYHKLLAGASWMAEYGDPDVPEEWAFLQQYSPYHNVKSSAEVKYPPILFTTSTRDDRVHPAHARKMVMKMLEGGHQEVYYYENIEGGHGGAADNKQTAFMQTLKFSFLEHVMSK